MLLKTLAQAVRGRRSSYEIQVCRDGRWIIDCVLTEVEEETAIARARDLLNADNCEQVKVLRQRGSGGAAVETQVFHESRKAKGKGQPTATAGVEVGFVCADLKELYQLKSRMVIGQVLREYLDREVVSPIELLHCYSHQKRLQACGNLMPSAVSIIAAAQGRLPGQNTKARMDVLYRLVDQAIGRARDLMAERKRVPALDEGGLSHLWQRIEARIEEPDRLFAAYTALANELTGKQSWGAKLDYLIGLFSADLPPQAAEMLDQAIADILGSGEVIKELLGPQPHLGAALMSLTALLQGQLPPPTAPGQELLAGFIKVLGSHDLPACRSVLLDRLRRALQGRQPLAKNDLDAELKLLVDLDKALKGPKGEVLGGPAITQAIAQRQQALRRERLRAIGIDG
jgi:hypothetical protein